MRQLHIFLIFFLLLFQITVSHADVLPLDDALRATYKACAGIDDYVKCASKNSNTFYEFQFDSVTTSIDNTIKNGIQTAVCKIHDAPATMAGCVGGGSAVGAMVLSGTVGKVATKTPIKEIIKDKLGTEEEQK